MNNIYEILEKCLIEIEQGADVDTVLFTYPEFADELRPILETSIKAMDMAAPEPSIVMVQINRTELLKRAAQMREAKVKSASRFWSVSLRRMAVTFIMLVALFVSGTGLVRASSNTIPGDNLYPVKRTWEDVLLLFTFNPQQREQLEFEHENERLEELNELIAEGRSAIKVDFAGYVTSQSETELRVSGIPVILSPQTVLPDQPVTVGAPVRIVGLTQGDGTVLAERVELLPVGAKLPEVNDDESEFEEENHDEQDPQIDGNSNSGSDDESPEIDETESPEDESETSGTNAPKGEFEIKDISFEGRLESIDSRNMVWTVSGQKLNVSSAEINGNPVIGAVVKVEGYYNSDDIFVVKKIEIISGSNASGNLDDDSNDNSNDNSNDDHEEDDDNNNNNHN